MPHDDLSIEDVVAQSVVPAREAAGRRGILREDARDLSSRRLWPLAQVEDVARAFAAAGAAVNEAEMFQSTPRGLAPAHPPGMLPGSAFPTYGEPPSRWWCKWAEGESWREYADRSLATFRAPVVAMREQVMLGLEGEHFVDFSFVTEDEMRLFELPGWVAARLAAMRESDGAGSFGIIQSARAQDGVRLNIARPLAGSYYAGPTSDLTLIPADARIARIQGSAKGLKRLGELASLEYLEVWRPGVKTLEAIARVPSLRVLQMHEVNAPALAPLAALQQLEALACAGRKVLRDVTALATLPRLRELNARLPGLDRLDQLGSLANLRALDIAADNNGRVASLAPLAALKELRHFRMWGIGVADGSLRPLARLSALRSVALQSRRFTLDQFAELAAALPEAEGLHRSPWDAGHVLAQYRGCRKCRGTEGYSTLGKPSRQFCAKCDTAKIEKHVARWEILVSAARARGGTGNERG